MGWGAPKRLSRTQFVGGWFAGVVACGWSISVRRSCVQAHAKSPLAATGTECPDLLRARAVRGCNGCVRLHDVMESLSFAWHYIQTQRLTGTLCGWGWGVAGPQRLPEDPRKQCHDDCQGAQYSQGRGMYRMYCARTACGGGQAWMAWRERSGTPCMCACVCLCFCACMRACPRSVAGCAAYSLLPPGAFVRCTPCMPVRCVWAGVVDDPYPWCGLVTIYPWGGGCRVTGS